MTSLLVSSLHCFPLLLSFFYCSGDHRDLHSFPTRRSSDLGAPAPSRRSIRLDGEAPRGSGRGPKANEAPSPRGEDRKSTRLNSSHLGISYAVFCLKKKKNKRERSTNNTAYETVAPQSRRLS